MTVTISKLDTNIIVEYINTGSSWVPKHNGVRLTHIPSKTIVECREYDSNHKNYAEALKTLNNLIKDNKPCISIPIEELEKLEQSRKDLYAYIENKWGLENDIWAIMKLTDITEQMWKVANKKDWGYNG